MSKAQNQGSIRWLALSLSVLVLGVGTVAAATESIGALHPGMTIGALEKQVGKPIGIEAQPPDCPGDAPLYVLDYSDRGLMLVAEGLGTGAAIQSISSFGKNQFRTARGVGVGATYDQVLAAYPSAEDPSRASFQVDLETGFLEISFSDDDPPRVIRILLTSEHPKIYQEGQDCGQPKN
jgi:hypothetical protein